MNLKNNIALGVDIGGSHISVAGIDISDLSILSDTYFNAAVDNKGSKTSILKTWAEVIQQAMDCIESNIQGIGIAIPGPFDYVKGIGMYEGNDKYENLYEQDIGFGLSKLLGVDREKIYFLNDAFSFVMGASLLHKAISKRVVGITLGTGFGASFLSNEFPVNSGEGIPEGGCLWDKTYKDNIADNFFSTRWFVKRYKELSGNSCEGVKEIVDFGNSYSQNIFNEFAQNLSDFLLPYLLKFEAETLLIGGGIAKSHPLFLKTMISHLPQEFDLDIQIIEDTEKCNMIGSAHLMTDDYWERILI